MPEHTLPDAPQDRLTVSELLEAVIARTHHDLRC